jgi:hypothetical protein
MLLFFLGFGCLHTHHQEFQWAPTLGGECYANFVLPTPIHSEGFNGHPPLGVNATGIDGSIAVSCCRGFQWAPTLGGECYFPAAARLSFAARSRFNGHPPLGVNATVCYSPDPAIYELSQFQWAPTLGGECYSLSFAKDGTEKGLIAFQWAPTLGGECYESYSTSEYDEDPFYSFQWAPTLGGECYYEKESTPEVDEDPL